MSTLRLPLALLGGLGSYAARAESLGLSIAGAYRTMRPATEKNIGRNRLKSRSKYMPHQGKRERARRLRQWARIAARGPA